MAEPVSRPLVYLDSNVFIYSLEGEPKISEPLRRFFSLLQGRMGTAVTSELTLAEVLAPPARSGLMALHIKRRLYLNLIVLNNAIDLKPISRDILYDTAELRNVSRHKLPDAIHIVTAVRCGCTFFMSGDHGTKRLPAGMKRLDTNEAGIRELIGHLNV